MDEAREEFEALLIVDKSALALEVVSFQPGGQTSKDSIFQGNSAFFLELAHEVDGSALAGELLHLAIV